MSNLIARGGEPAIAAFDNHQAHGTETQTPATSASVNVPQASSSSGDVGRAPRGFYGSTPGGAMFPRCSLPRLLGYRVVTQVDDVPVWSRV